MSAAETVGSGKWLLREIAVLNRQFGADYVRSTHQKACAAARYDPKPLQHTVMSRQGEWPQELREFWPASESRATARL
jgi:hypothetical protein